MTAPMAGGRRRIDRVLAEDFLADLDSADLETLRAMRAEAEQEEVDLSYVRRLIQGRIDIADAERHRRVSGGEGSRLREWMRHSRPFDRKAIQHHYDVGDDFFALWLDRRRVYSCGYFRRADDTLERALRGEPAQRDRISRVVHRVLDAVPDGFADLEPNEAIDVISLACERARPVPVPGGREG